MPIFDFKRDTTLTDATEMPRGWGYIHPSKMDTVPNVSEELFKQQSLVVPRDLTEVLAISDGEWNIVNKTEDYTIEVADSRTMFTNFEAEQLVVFTLPPLAADPPPIAGKTRFAFFSLAQWPIRVVPVGSVIFGFGGVGPFPVTQTEASAAYVESTGLFGEYLVLYYLGGIFWGATTANGDWE